MAYSDFRNMLMASSAAAVVFVAAPAWAQQVKTFDIAAQPAASGITAFSRQADVQILVSAELVEGRRTSRVVGEMTVDAALRQLLTGTGLSITSNDGRTYTLGLTRQQRSEVFDDVTAVADIIVTAQKREESIQDVPIAVSAFSAQTLDAMKIEGGSELLRAIPNVAFSKNNFSMYNFSIRGIGTKAISAASDPAVAVSFNNSPMIRNRLFEAEYLDVNRVEVLRGPQGTLYGRNATAGVVNMIPNMPGPDFDASLKSEVGNFGTIRAQGMLNIPLSDTFWVRGAASMTKREGFDYNTFKDKPINGRDLHSVRLGATWEPSERFNATMFWERFVEDDDRSRTGKQLCTRDPGPDRIGSHVLSQSATDMAIRGKLSQGCLPGSLYDDAAFQTPNATGMAQLLPLTTMVSLGNNKSILVGGVQIYAVSAGTDPYGARVQSRNLREIEAEIDPKYLAENDIFQLNLNYKFNDNLSIVYNSMYTRDKYQASQDYARYLSNEIFNDSNGRTDFLGNVFVGSTISPGGIFTDPQLGPSKRMLTADRSQSENDQIYHEIRFQSQDFNRANFNIGVNYLEFNTEDNYYVFNNTFTMLAQYLYNKDNTVSPQIVTTNCVDSSTFVECSYVDPSSLGDLAGDGHNYFRSKNVVRTNSAAVFGELYLALSDTINTTFGLRYTSDKKVTTPYPSQLLLGYSDFLGGATTGGSVVRGLVADPDVKQSWGAVTGRAVLDWKPTEDLMVYASLARGYKGGGMNPPRADINPEVIQYQPLPESFEPEYVNSFEIGMKSTLLEGSLKLNATAFYYDYKDYQVSQIVDRISLNENFDSESFGVEFEAVWRPTSRLRIDGNLGMLKTKIGKGENSIDVMNRTQGNEDWVLVRPWVQVPSNCIAPKKHVETILNHAGRSLWPSALSVLCGGASRIGTFDPDFPSNVKFYNTFRFNYNPLVDAPNGGRGFSADLSGNELPNAPRISGNIGIQYSLPLGAWSGSVRADYYRQSKSYFRVYNTEYDRIRGWGSANFTVSVTSPDDTLELQAYVKNAFDDAPIVDAFTNSDDSMLTTNVFTLDPRIVGFSLTKRF